MQRKAFASKWKVYEWHRALRLLWESLSSVLAARNIYRLRGHCKACEDNFTKQPIDETKFNAKLEKILLANVSQVWRLDISIWLLGRECQSYIFFELGERRARIEWSCRHRKLSKSSFPTRHKARHPKTQNLWSFGFPRRLRRCLRIAFLARLYLALYCYSRHSFHQAFRRAL